MTKRTAEAKRTQGGNGAARELAHLVEPMLAGMTITRHHLLVWVHAHGLAAVDELFREEGRGPGWAEGPASGPAHASSLGTMATECQADGRSPESTEIGSTTSRDRPRKAGVFQPNLVGATIWRLIDEPRSVSDLRETVLESQLLSGLNWIGPSLPSMRTGLLSRHACSSSALSPPPVLDDGLPARQVPLGCRRKIPLSSIRARRRMMSSAFVDACGVEGGASQSIYAVLKTMAEVGNAEPAPIW
jgi:hypothetical protein